MGPRLLLFVTCFLMLSTVSYGRDFEKDVIETSQGKLEITFIGHGTLMFQCAGKVIHIDPVGREAEYSNMPKADLILITHHHRDHLDLEAVSHIKKADTTLILTKTCAEKISGGEIMRNGSSTTWNKVKIEALPAYNLVHRRDSGEVFHPKGIGNSYLLTFGDKRIFIGGDTENIPEIKGLKNINVAFLPMNVPYTMTPEMVADAAKAFKPGILYPYHYGETDPKQLVSLLKNNPEIEVRIRSMR